MSNWSKSIFHGGIYTKTQGEKGYSFGDQQIALKYKNIARDSWKKAEKILAIVKENLLIHISKKQEYYWPVLVAIVLLLFVFASRMASAEISGAPNNLPIKSTSRLNIIGFGEKNVSGKTCLSEGKNEIKIEKAKFVSDYEKNLRDDVAGILKSTPMSAMIDAISKKDRTVAAFIVGIAMKESKFGVYAPHLGGRDCYNYWGLKAGGKTVSGGYTCFASPDEAVEVVGKNIERMVAKGVRTPAQAISWKCGSTCAGHDPGGVRKWIADVGVNFYKINS